ncbi:MAG: asparaginase [Pseudomonadota bacterium]
MANPVLVNKLRGTHVECRHRGSVAVCDIKGRLVYSHGDTEALVYPRSAIKALQALPLVESGAADHYAISQAELALACSSHGAEPEHVDAVQRWLHRIDLDAADLECGAHLPLHEPSAEALVAAGDKPSRAHNNCSGKHTGMLCSVQHLGESVLGYSELKHPAQQRWVDVMNALTDIDISRNPWGYDGCGIPVFTLPLRSVALAFARFATPVELEPVRAAAATRIAEAIAAHPFMVAGRGRLCTDLMALTGLRVMVKTGAEGVYTAALPQRGLGIALKIDDGNGLAAQVALLATLKHLGELTDEECESLAGYVEIPVLNTREVRAGALQASNVWQLQA